jgi:hypothetical protein
VSGLLGRTPATAPAGGSAPVDAGRAERSAAAVAADSLVMPLIAFSALAAFATTHWGMLVVDAPVGRMLLVLLVATGGAAALGLLGRAPLPRAALHAIAAVMGVVMLGLGLMAAGLPGRLLLPAHWPELFDGIDRGLALRRSRAVDPPHGPARRARAPDDRRTARLLAGAQGHARAAHRRPDHPPAALRNGRCRA